MVFRLMEEASIAKDAQESSDYLLKTVRICEPHLHLYAHVVTSTEQEKESQN